METNGYIDFSIRFFDGLHRRRKNDVTVVQILSNLYFTAGDRKNSFRMDKKHVLLDPLNPIAHYNLACDFSLSKKIPEAVQSLTKAIMLGCNDFQWIRDDVDLDPIRNDIRFKSVIDRYFSKTSSK